LEEVVRFYDRGGVPHDGLDPLIGPLNLADEEIAVLVAFLESLTSPDVAALVADARSTPVGN
jgi:cytochrome c peroxidase